MSVLVSPCVLKFEIDIKLNMNADEDIDEMSAGAVASEHPNNPRLLKEQRGQRQPKKITVENFHNVKYKDEEEEKGILPKSSREQTPMDDSVISSPKNELTSEINFFSGNPFVEVTKGILHLYKKNERTDINEGLSKTLCLLAVPASLNCHDLLNFIAPCHEEIQHVRILRDGSPNQFMVLIDFRSTESAKEFYSTFNGAPYSSLEPDSLCHALWVSSVQYGDEASVPAGHTELPTCPVCLERMDESIDGVLTILCNHVFHAGCLIKWGDSTCPVCRCVQTPELSENSVCMECEGTEALWICLICGHVGCGRYQGGHAASHFRTTNHTYALQLGSNRVWDYAGDNFVHRLLQSKTDGKLVATQSPGGVEDEKIDSIQLEFTYLLTAQLDKQREYYEERLARIESMIVSDNEKQLVEMQSIRQKNQALETKLQNVMKDKNTIEKKLNQMHTKFNTTLKDLAEEKQFGKTLQLNHTSWQNRYATLEKQYQEKEAEIADLKDQVRDLMFYMEAQNTIAKSDMKDEIATGSVQLNDPEGNAKTRRKKNNK